ncbi:ParB N-terminal domain-containing protein [Streptomyces sp. NPDC101150]|uniref:ParB N-terminal domain-containing protein n=1 Tax=Streptomyces sp. NPDC101150 TaxID=3366114 RepID=UPI003806A498
MTIPLSEDAPHGGTSDYILALRDAIQDSVSVETIPLAALTVSNSPRIDGEDRDYTRALAESVETLPPILVHRPTLQVIDGVHRLRAAALRGHDHIAVRFFDGPEEDGYLLAIAVNVAHGMPLSIQDRIAAALRIFTSHPSWSNRAVGAVAGLSPAKVADLRRQQGGEAAQSKHRIGRDGRSRPVDVSQGRQRARELMEDFPDISLRQIAKQAGISAATVADVRNRMRRGESVVPLRQPPAASATAAVLREAVVGPVTRALPPRPSRSPEDLAQVLDSLRRDPSLRHSQSGRALLRILGACVALTRERKEVIATLPTHCRGQLSELFQGYGQVWQALANELKQTEPMLPSKL